MAGPAPARLAALDVLRAVRTGALADRALDRVARDMDARERALAQEIAYGVLRLRGRIDHQLRAHSRRTLESLDPDILDILRIGAYQLTAMDGVPDYAAVSESVELARGARRGAEGFVNAVLQSLRRSPDAQTFPALAADATAHLATWGSLPHWLAKRWVVAYGAEGGAQLAERANVRPDIYLRVLGEDVAGVVERLRQAGVETESVPLLERARRITAGSVATALEAAPVIVQDPAAGLVVELAGAVPDRVVDLAAAPGGKAMGLAGDAPSAERLVVAADLSRSRLRRLQGNVRRISRAHPAGIGATGIVAVAADGRHPPFRPVPMVLIDAPCTGTGTFRRHPDGKWRITPDDIEALARVQAGLLDAAAALVEPGGLLLYATCSLEPEENEVQVRSFLERHGGFHTEPRDVGADVIDDEGFLRVLPHVHGVDGAFGARLRRVN